MAILLKWTSYKENYTVINDTTDPMSQSDYFWLLIMKSQAIPNNNM